MPEPSCQLCDAERMTEWYHDDDVCWVAECESCAVPMVVLKRHARSATEEERAHMLVALGAVADSVIGQGTYRIDEVMRQIPDHCHAHARRRHPLML